MQHIVVGQPVDRADPDVLQRRRVAWLQRIDRVGPAKFERMHLRVELAHFLG